MRVLLHVFIKLLFFNSSGFGLIKIFKLHVFYILKVWYFTCLQYLVALQNHLVLLTTAIFKYSWSPENSFDMDHSWGVCNKQLFYAGLLTCTGQPLP